MLKIRFSVRLDFIGRGWQRIKVIPLRGELTFPGKCNLAKAAPQKERNRDDDSQLRHFHSMLTTQTTLSKPRLSSFNLELYHHHRLVYHTTHSSFASPRFNILRQPSTNPSGLPSPNYGPLILSARPLMNSSSHSVATAMSHSRLLPNFSQR